MITKDIRNWLSNNNDLKRILFLIHHVSIIEYNGENIDGSRQLAWYFSKTGLNPAIVGSIILCGHLSEKTVKNKEDLKKMFPSAEVTCTNKEWKLIDVSKTKKHDPLVFHFAFAADISSEDFDDSEENDKCFVDIVNATRHAYYVCILSDNDSFEEYEKKNVRFREKLNLTDFVFNRQHEHNCSKPTQSCLEKQDYMKMCEETFSEKDIFLQCAEEAKQGCEECNQCRNYKKGKRCPIAQRKIAEFYRKGIFVPANKVIAHQWEMMAARQGLKQALLQVADDLRQGVGCKQSVAEAFEIYSEFAREGDTFCIDKIIEMSDNYVDIPHIVAIPYIAQLAQNGNEDMILKLFDAFKDDKYGLPNDVVQQEEWIKQGAENGNPRFVEAMACMHENNENWTEAYKWLKKLEEINPDAVDYVRMEQIEIIMLTNGKNSYEVAVMGMNLLYGYHGVERNTRLAYRCLKYAKEQHEALAEGLLGRMYEEGIDVECDIDKAIELLTDAAEKGDLLSMEKLIILNVREMQKHTENEKYGQIVKKRRYWLEKIETAIIQKAANNNPIALYFKAGYTDCGLELTKDNKQKYFLIKESANLGYPPAQYQLAKMYENGYGTEKDYSLYDYWIEQAANNGYYEAEGEMGMRLFHYRSNNAFNYLRNAIEKGYDNHEANWFLAQCYMHGKGTPVLKQIAYPMYIKAAEQGIAEAQEFLCKEYYYGNAFLPKSYKECARWGEEALRQGRDSIKFETAYSLSQIGEKERAKVLYLEMAGQGNAAAMNNIGCMCTSNEEAAKWFLKAADKGDEVGQSNIARYFRYGIGVEKNIGKALDYYKKSASQGYVPSMLNLAHIFRWGEDTDKNIGMAINWCKKAIEKDEVKAMAELANIYFTEDGFRNYQLSFSYYKMAEEKGDIQSRFQLGVFYELGLGIEKNIHKAIYWYRKAAEKGNDTAKEKLKKLGAEWCEDNKEDEE